MRILSRFFALLGTSCILAVSGFAQPSAKPVYSIDFQTLSARQVAIGKVTSYRGEDGWDRKRAVTVTVEQSLKGNCLGTITIETPERNVADLKRWQTTGTRVLVFFFSR